MSLAETDSKLYWSFAGYSEMIQKTGFSCAVVLRIHYRGADGKKTIRTVDCTHWTPKQNGGAFVGNCRLRGELRSFRFDRVERVYDLEISRRVDSLESLFFSHLNETDQIGCALQFPIYQQYLPLSIRSAKSILNSTISHPKAAGTMCSTCHHRSTETTKGGDYKCNRCGSIFRY